MPGSQDGFLQGTHHGHRVTTVHSENREPQLLDHAVQRGPVEQVTGLPCLRSRRTCRTEDNDGHTATLRLLEYLRPLRTWFAQVRHRNDESLFSGKLCTGRQSAGERKSARVLKEYCRLRCAALGRLQQCLQGVCAVRHYGRVSGLQLKSHGGVYGFHAPKGRAGQRGLRAHNCAVELLQCGVGQERIFGHAWLVLRL